MIGILGLATALPPYRHTQCDIALWLKARLPDADQAKMVRIFERACIDSRYSALPDLSSGDTTLLYQPSSESTAGPSTLERNRIYEEEAPKLAVQAARKALQDWGGLPSEITHVISVSCTGMMAPGIEFLLVDRLGLDRSVERIGVNFMGCFGAFRGLSVAKALANQDPSHRVLVVCTELCSLHCQFDANPETFVANALFADGAAAVVVGQAEEEEIVWNLDHHSQYAVDASLDEMTWTVGDTGFLMQLTTQVPKAICNRILHFCERLAGPKEKFSEMLWAIHPGGKAILEGVRRACGLVREQLSASWQVLAEYGNMSSGTMLFILDRMRATAEKNRRTVGLGFGPGLSIEGIVLHRGGRA